MNQPKKHRNDKWIMAAIAGGILLLPSCGGTGQNQSQGLSEIPPHLQHEGQLQEQQLQMQQGEQRRQIREMQLKGRGAADIPPNGGTGRFRMQSGGLSPVTIPYMEREGEKYISVSQLAETLEFRSKFNESAGILKLGDYGEEFEFNVNSNVVKTEGEQIQLSKPSVLINGGVYMPASAAEDMFRNDMNAQAGTDGLVLSPSSIPVDGLNFNDGDEGNDPNLNFGDEPHSPSGEEDQGSKTQGNEAQGNETSGDGTSPSMNGDQEEALPALVSANESSLLSTAKKYIGVDYEFGTESYPKSGTFDCSTFTQHVFDKYGVNLPRTARSQARNGIEVSRKNLRPGDLMFFYVPGRFKSNRTIGHVAIYMGDNQMIHASPEPQNGVQITDINKAYWKRTFLTAKRLVQ
ncbi:C40 family peptidase [Paenibacillus swuensis]|uniref:C40 family peptidase n=1 Tax=Paenibacillus swuensis TaxID=1178515 RepID=UPI00083819D8|nr:C40 family peptidase [Paenibacillus swuensis]